MHTSSAEAATSLWWLPLLFVVGAVHHLNPRDARIILAELVRRFTPAPVEKVARRVWRFIQDLHPKQLFFRKDAKRLRAGSCSRRAGKSVVGAALLLEECGNRPGAIGCYVGITRRAAKRVMWRELKRFNRRYALGLRFNETDLICTLRNRSEIHLFASNNEADVDRLRGTPFVLCIIDEAQAFGDHIRKLYSEVLRPATIDYDGRVIMFGTPSPACAGFFYEVSTGSPNPVNGRTPKGWSVHNWTMFDNPYLQAESPDEPEDLPNEKAWAWFLEMCEEEGHVGTLKAIGKRSCREVIDDIAKRGPAAMPGAEASVLREYFGLWVPDVTSLVYSGYAKPRNVISFEKWRRIFKSVKRELWVYGLSVDLGYDDETVFTVTAFHEALSDIYTIKVIAKTGMIVSEVASMVQELQTTYGAFAFVVVDTSGNGKMIAEEITRVYHIPCRGAEKTRKKTFIDLCNSDLKTGRVKIVEEECEALLDEIPLLQWNETLKARGRYEEDERFKNDACDGFVYAYREARHMHGFDGDVLPEEMRPEPGSEEALDAEADAHADRMAIEDRRREREEEFY